MMQENASSVHHNSKEAQFHALGKRRRAFPTPQPHAYLPYNLTCASLDYADQQKLQLSTRYSTRWIRLGGMSAPGAARAFGQRPQSDSTVSFVVAIDRASPPTQDITIRIAVGDRADVMAFGRLGPMRAGALGAALPTVIHKGFRPNIPGAFSARRPMNIVGWRRA